MFDTNAVIALLKGHDRVLGRVRNHQPKDFGISSIVQHELFYGAYKSQRPDENRARIEALRFDVLAFDDEDSRSAGKVRADLARLGTPIGSYDVLIAGQALARSLILVTNNTREFFRIANLRVEDWQA